MKSGPLFRLLCLGLGAAIVALTLDLVHGQPPIPARADWQVDVKALRRAVAGDQPALSLHRLRFGALTEQRSVNAFQLVYDSRRTSGATVVIDSGIDPRTHRKLSDAANRNDYDTAAYEQLQNELLRTTAVWFTEETLEHVDGLARSPNLYGIRDRIRFTEDQLRSPTLRATRFPPSVLEALVAVDCAQICRLAPGLASIAAPTVRSPGARWLYVRLASGRELLLVGDAMLSQARIRALHAPSRLDFWWAGRDARSVNQALRVLHDLMQQHPELYIVPVQDEATLKSFEADGVLQPGFVYRSPFS